MKLYKPASMVRAVKRFSPVLLFLFFLSNSFCNRDTTDQLENSSRNLNNKTSSFIYNVIPQNNNASISPEYSKAINTFSVNLLEKVYSETQFNKKNVVLNPFSVSRCLAVLTEGAIGKSKSELIEALGGQVALDDAVEALTELIYADNSIIFQCADAIWIRFPEIFN